MKNKKAFSLIEISVVLIVLAVLFASIVSGSKIIAKANLSSAQSLTNTSPVASTSGIVAWFETTSGNSFPTALSDTNPVSQWNDLNPQGTVKLNVAEGTNKPTYAANSLNGLPSIKFDGTNDILASSSNIGMSSNPDVTIFVVAKINADAESCFTDWGAATSGNDFCFGEHTGGIAANFHTLLQRTNDNTSKSAAKIYSWIRIGGTNNSITGNTIRFNGTTQATTTPTGPETGNVNVTDSVLRIGARAGGGFINANIGEVIIFNRALKSFEIKAIEQYLGAKWKIKIA